MLSRNIKKAEIFQTKKKWEKKQLTQRIGDTCMFGSEQIEYFHSLFLFCYFNLCTYNRLLLGSIHTSSNFNIVNMFWTSYNPDETIFNN